MKSAAYYIPILGYHRVGLFRGDHVPTVSAGTFERQLALLARKRVRVIGLEAVADALERGNDLPRHSTVITFDDGYEETCTVAWPLLKRFGFPSTVFVTPGELETSGFMTWAQTKQMANDGVTIGSHTMHHSYLPLVEEGRLNEELVESKRVIERQIDRPVQFISYPIGGFTPKVQAVVQQAGYRAACTTNRRSSAKGIDRYALRRVKVTERDTHWLTLWAKVSGYYDLFRQLKEPG